MRERPGDDQHPDYVGDGHDPDPLLTAKGVAEWLQVPEDSVYDLPIPRVKISERRIRWRPEDVRDFVDSRTVKS